MINHVFDKLYQGNMEGVIEALKTKEVDVIVYLGQGLPKGFTFKSSLPIIHIPLNDGENTSLKIDLALLNISYLEIDDKVLVACRAGLSRSVAICAAYLKLYRSEDFPEDFDECLEFVRKITKSRIPPAQDLIDSIKNAINNYWENK